MPKVKFYDRVDDKLLRFAVIAARHNNQWVFCKQKMRSTYEIPGGRREPGEDILDTARRELYEETGAAEYDIRPVCVYSVAGMDGSTGEEETYGMLYYADIAVFGELPDFEMEKVILFDRIPAELTYPFIQPELMKKVELTSGYGCNIMDEVSMYNSHPE